MRQITLAFRMLFRTPFVTAVAVLSLGLGIGVNTAIFSLFNQILMRPLPVQAPAGLVNLTVPGNRNGSVSCNNSGDCDATFSYPMYRDLSADPRGFAALAAHRVFGANVGYQNETVGVDGAEVSGNYFSVLGLQPVVGRLIAPADTSVAGGAAVAVLSYDYWTTRFKHDPAVVGSAVVVNGQSLAIVGVAPQAFDGTTRGTRVKIFVPITMRNFMEPPFNGFEARDNYWVYTFARLAPGTTMAAAATAINTRFQQQLRDVELPLQSGLTDAKKNEFVTRKIVLSDGRRGQSYIFSQATTPLTVLQVVTVVVLLIACANIANLLLARAAGRAGEMAVRLSIGASRAQLVRQLLIESCLLSALGGLAGLVFLKWTVSLMLSQLAIGTLDPVVAQVSVGTLLFAAALSIGTGVLFGLFPALHATRPDLASTLKGQAGQPSGARAAKRFRSALVVTQIALSMGLLASAGLFAKSLLNVSRVDLGVKVDHVVTFGLNPQRNGYTVVRAQQLFADLMARLAATPGVESVSAATVPIIGGSSSSTSVSVEGYTYAPNERQSASYSEVAPAFFRTAGITLIAGREFTDGDVSGAPKVAIVNEAFARKYNLAANPVGRRMARGVGNKTVFDIEIVGYVRDAKYNSVRSDVPAVFYTPYRQNDRIGALAFYVKVGRDPDAFVRQIRPLVTSFDPNLPVNRLMTMPEQIAQNVSSDRMMSQLSALFAGLATALAAIGLYGVLAYTVSQRTREFGLRMALGADPANVQRLVLRQVLWMTIVGAVIGLGLAIGAGQMAKALLFQMSGADPVVLTASTAALALVALAAGFIPSVRASRVDPMRALRWE